MNRKEKILTHLKSWAPSTGKQLSQYLGISRQALNIHLKELIAAGKVIKTGSTKNAQYYPGDADLPSSTFSKPLKLASTDESNIYELMSTTLNLKSELKPKIESIIHYAFTEMLNNAIDHAKTDLGKVSVTLGPGTINFEIRDYGIGIFHSIASKFQLEDENAAMLELTKGRITTMPSAHTGEGIFFTSKIADRFELRSHRIRMEWDRDRNDIYVSQIRSLKGTLVKFFIRRAARQVLEDVFAEFAPQDYDYQFQKTKILVKLLQSEYMSRSEGRRLTHNLHRFREIMLDFKGVNSIGQGFADEVFRVFKNQHPGISIKATNANSVVNAMVQHVNAQ